MPQKHLAVVASRLLIEQLKVKVYYRSARPADAKGCVTVLRDWIDETPWIRAEGTQVSMEVFWRGMLRTEAAWVAEYRRIIYGFCLRSRSEENNIGALYVARVARKQGVGKRLLDLAKVDCEYVTVWAFEKNMAARRFYAREGLREVSRERDEFNGLMDVEHRWERVTQTTEKRVLQDKSHHRMENGDKRLSRPEETDRKDS